ncbi:MAG: hypothetical protein HDQ87_05075 [Clostridia bacterium]|nr:hypothetical protein [Clostridia bacterium]
MRRRFVTVLLASLMLLTCLAAPALATEDLPVLIPGRGLGITENDTLGPLLTGLQARTSDNPTPMDVIMCFYVPGYWSLIVEAPDGEDISISEAPVATGDRLIFTDTENMTETTTIIVRGDVLGTGVLAINQLVAIAGVISGQNELTGPYALAADLNSSGAPDIADLVMEANLIGTGGISPLPAGYPDLSSVAQAAYLLNPRDGGEIDVQDGTVTGPLASTVLYALIDLHAKWQNQDPESPAEGLLGRPDEFNPLLLDVLTTCSMEPVEDGRFEYRFDAVALVRLLNALFGLDVENTLRQSVEEMEGDVFWQDDYIELSGIPVGGSTVRYIGIGSYPNPANTYEFESHLVYDVDEDGEELVASMWFTAQIRPQEDAAFGFHLENCRFAAAAG